MFPVRENFVLWCFSQKLQKIVFCNTFHFLLNWDRIPWAISMANTLLQTFSSVFSLLKLLQWSPGYLCGRTRPGGSRARGGDTHTWRGILPPTLVMLLSEITRPPLQKLKCHLPLWKCLFYHISTRIKGHFHRNSKFSVGLVMITWGNCTMKQLLSQVLILRAFTGTLK